MARKKKKPVELKLTQLEIARLDLHQARNDLQLQIIEKFKGKLLLHTLDYQREQAIMKGKIRDSENSGKEAREDYNAQIKAIEKRLDVDMKKYIVADDGTLTHEDDL